MLAETEEEMTDGELAAKARRDRVAVLVEQRREQLSIVKANAAAEEQRRSERRARRNARRHAAAMRIQACARGKRCRQAWLATRDRLMAEREDLRDKRGVLRLAVAREADKTQVDDVTVADLKAKTEKLRARADTKAKEAASKTAEAQNFASFEFPEFVVPEIKVDAAVGGAAVVGLLSCCRAKDWGFGRALPAKP